MCTDPENFLQDGYEDNAEDDDGAAAQFQQRSVRLGLAGLAGVRLSELRGGRRSGNCPGDTGA